MTVPLDSLLDPSVKHNRIEKAVSDLWSSQQRAEYGLCLGLRRLKRDQVHRRAGRSSFRDWAEHRFGIPRKLAGTFSWIGSVLEGLPLTRVAMARGELTYTKVREFMVQATPETEAEWIEFAKTHTNREIEARVRRKQRRDGTETTKFVSRVTPPERQALRKAREIIQKKTGRSIRRDKLLGEMATTIAQGGLFGADRASGGEDGDAPALPNKPSAYVSIQPCPICLDTFVPVPEGLLRVPMKAWMKAIRAGAEPFDLTDHFLCDCEGEKHRRDRCTNWKRPEATAAPNRSIPAAVRRRIQARDGFVCRTTGCSCEVPLEYSHLVPFRDGAAPALENIRQHCATCNDLIETGRLHVVGLAPYERYYDAEGNYLGNGSSRSDPHVGMRDDPVVRSRRACWDPPEQVPLDSLAG